MPIRIVCPSCSAALSVKDELAGRAVKCPKCGGVIQAPKAAAAPPLPPAPEKAPFEEVDEPAKPPKSGSKPSIPAVKSKDPDEEGEDRPRRRGRDDRDRDERDRDDRDERREKSKRRDRDDDRDRDREDDRPAKRRRRDDDRDRGDDDDRPRGEKKNGSSGLTIVLVICGVLGVCCLTGVGGVWYALREAKKGVQEFAENMGRNMLKGNYDTLAVGTTTRQDAELFFGPGRTATNDDLDKAFATDAASRAKWVPFVTSGRAMVWSSPGGEDFVFAAFHPNAKNDARVQMKEWRPKTGSSEFDGIDNDVAFLQKYPVTPKPGVDPQPNQKEDEPPPGVTTKVTAEDLAQAFKDNQPAAISKYQNKWWVVEGKVLDVAAGPIENGKETAIVKLVGVKDQDGDDFSVWCHIRAEETRAAWDTARGQTIKIKGQCTDGGFDRVNVKYGRIEGKGQDPASRVLITVLLNEFKMPDAANEKYKDKEVCVTSARVVSVDGDTVLFSSFGKTGTIKVQAKFNSDQRKKLDVLKPNNPVNFRAKCDGLVGENVAFHDAYIVP